MKTMVFLTTLLIIEIIPLSFSMNEQLGLVLFKDACR